VSAWDEEASDWSVPVNLGFPYSSPADDFLYAASEDGRYVLFASDRDCPSDSVWVYVLEEDNMPVRSEMSDPQQLKNLASMNVKTGVGKATGERHSPMPRLIRTKTTVWPWRWRRFRRGWAVFA
jgi:hypothetical protein